MHASAIRVSAPGKLMLMGEHAVLHGRHAVVAAVNRRISVTLTPRDDSQATITSAIGEWSGTINDLTPVAPFRFILQVAQTASPSTGFDLAVESDFPPTVGLGSSSAVTVAAVGAFSVWQTGSLASENDLLDQTLDAIRTVQGGAGSGADAAAAIYGGILLYRASPRVVTRVPSKAAITVRYSGSKTPTPEVIAIVEAERTKDPERTESIFNEMDALSLELAEALKNNHLASSGSLLNQGQKLMAQLGVSTPALDQLAADLANARGITGAKISGAGLGDCVIGLGITDDYLPGDPVQAAISQHGIRIE